MCLEKINQHWTATKFLCFMPKELERRISHVLYLLHRAKKICSTKLLFQSEVFNLRQIFSKNRYPASFFNQILEKFLTRSDGVPNQDLDSSREQERKFILTVPYLGKPSKSFFKKAQLLIESKLDIEITPIFKTTKSYSYFSI